MIKEIILDGRLVRYDLQRKSVKNINIRVRRDLSVHVSASPHVAQKKIEEILLEKSDFILSALSKYESLAPKDFANQRQLNNGDMIDVLGQKLPISVKSGAKARGEIRENRILITVKDLCDTSAKEKALQVALDALCRETIENMCREIYPKFEKYLPCFPEIKFRHMRSRWGSCNYKKYILTLNYALIGAPRECVEYVVYHEFTHFIHPNHSADFYLELSRHVPDYKMLKKALEKVNL